MDVCVYLSFQIKPQIGRKWLGKCNPKDKLNKSTRMICLIYFNMAQFNDIIKFRCRNLNNNDLMLINLHISLIERRVFRYFDRHSDKTFSQLFLNINNFSYKIVDVIRKSHEFTLKIVRVITIVVSNSVNFLVNALLWRQSFSLRILDDVTILAVESIFLYSIHPEWGSTKNGRYSEVVRKICWYSEVVRKICRYCEVVRKSCIYSEVVPKIGRYSEIIRNICSTAQTHALPVHL